MTAYIVCSVIIIIAIIYCIYNSYEKKVNQVKKYFQDKLSQFNELKKNIFEIETTGKKIKTWDKQHTVDYVILQEKDKIINFLKVYNNYGIWWEENIKNVIKAAKNIASNISSEMIILDLKFYKRAILEIKNLVKNNDPNNIQLTFRTYTYHSNTRHYNPNTHVWWSDHSPIKTTFLKSLSPKEVLIRLEILAKYNFEMTEYQHNCDNQRKLMTKELRNEIIERDHSICQICKKKCLRNEIEVDHIQPISKGGKTIRSNLQVLCLSCNRKKSNKWLEDLLSKNMITKPTIQSNTEHENEKQWESFNKKYNETKYNNLKQSDQCAQIGDKITIQFINENEKMTFTLVESNASRNRFEVSVNSPIGQAVFGQEEGCEISAHTPNGIESIKILLIEKAKNNNFQ